MIVTRVINVASSQTLYSTAMEPERARRLISALRSDDALARRDAARELGDARVTAAVPALIEALRRPEPEDKDLHEHTSRAAAAVALGRIGEPSAAGALLEAIADPFNLGTAASTALGRLKPPPVEALVAATRDSSPWRRARAAAALGEIGDRSAFDAIARLLADAEDAVSRAAAAAFEKLRDPRAVEPLLALLADASRSTFVRSYAAMTLGALKDPKAVDALLAELQSHDALMRRSAARALCRIDDPRSRDTLARLAAEDPDKSVREVVLRYLQPRPGQRPH
jgi:HEAT repeat protein